MLGRPYINWQALIQVQDNFLFKKHYIIVFQNFGSESCFQVVFDNTGIPSERIRICKSVEEIQKLDPDTTNIFKRNMVGTYTDRPNIRYKAGMYDICFEIFVAHYYLGYENKDENDSQPDVFGDETKETPQGISETLPKSLTLMSFSEKLKLRKTIQVLKYHVPNKHPRNSTHYLLFMFYPF